MTFSPEEWTPYKRRWFARKFPKSWPGVKERLEAATPRPRVEIEIPSPPVDIDWNAIRPRAPVLSITAKRVILLCAVAANTSVEELTGQRRHRAIVAPRQAAIFLILRHCKYVSLSMAGKMLGNRDHTTALHARRRVQVDLDSGGDVFGEIVKHVESALYPVESVDCVDSGDCRNHRMNETA